MADTYTYKKIQKMREALIDELKLLFPTMNAELYTLVEHRLQTAIMAGLFDDQVKR